MDYCNLVAWHTYYNYTSYKRIWKIRKSSFIYSVFTTIHLSSFCFFFICIYHIHLLNLIHLIGNIHTCQSHFFLFFKIQELVWSQLWQSHVAVTMIRPLDLDDMRHIWCQWYEITSMLLTLLLVFSSVVWSQWKCDASPWWASHQSVCHCSAYFAQWQIIIH